ncbi:MAG: c-type cytochrome [Acidobacteriia bacterium]|nr:c-type cytochrome [Terriglobia bacterium]
MTKRALFILTVAITAMPAFANDLAGAKVIFRKRCTGCHTYGKGVKVGPDLRGVTERRQRFWLTSFIRSSSKVIQSGDPTAVTLFHQYKQERMPDWTDLSQEQIDAILDYFAADGPSQKEPDERHASTATAAEIEVGRQLFLGQARFASGGRMCITCHSVRTTGVARGGTLGPDLTRAYFKYQDKALTDFLKHPCSVMASARAAGAPLSPQESFDLKAFLARAAGLSIPAPGKGPVVTIATAQTAAAGGLR